MADTEAIVRLMHHAANRLGQEDPTLIADGPTRQERIDRALSAAVAMAAAEAILRVVANIMTDSEEPGDAVR